MTLSFEIDLPEMLEMNPDEFALQLRKLMDNIADTDCRIRSAIASGPRPDLEAGFEAECLAQRDTLESLVEREEIAWVPEALMEDLKRCMEERNATMDAWNAAHPH